jgi:hypothetical protein
MLERKDNDGTNKTCSNRKRKNVYHIEILGISETRWNGSGEHRIPEGGILLYSSKPINAKHESGVGILLSQNARKSHRMESNIRQDYHGMILHKTAQIGSDPVLYTN